MWLAADSFGSYGARKPTRALRVACALDRAVVWTLGVVLALALAVSAYTPFGTRMRWRMEGTARPGLRR